jgi:hypothetical protein
MTEPFVNQRLVLAGTQRLVVDAATGGQSVVKAGPAGPRGLSISGGGSGSGTIFVDGFGFGSTGSTITDPATATHVSVDGVNHDLIHVDDLIAFYKTSSAPEADVLGIYVCVSPGVNTLLMPPSAGLSFTVKHDSTQEADFGQGPFGLYGVTAILDERAGVFVPTSSVATSFEITEGFVNSHKAESFPHAVYDDMASLTLIFENGLV